MAQAVLLPHTAAHDPRKYPILARLPACRRIDERDGRAALFPQLGPVCLGDSAAAARSLCRARRSDRARDPLVAAIRDHLRCTCRGGVLAVAAPRLHAALCRLGCIRAVVFAGVGAAVSVCAGFGLSYEGLLS